MDESKYINPKPVYVVVLVSYDYYRFQENYYAAINLKQARAYANELKEKVLPSYNRDEVPVIEDKERSYAMDESEGKHIWIQKL